MKTAEQIAHDSPEPDKGLTLYLDLFLMLESERKDGTMPIPVTAQLACIDYFGLDEYQEDFLLVTFAIADRIVLAQRRSKGGNSPPTVDPDARPRRKAARGR